MKIRNDPLFHIILYEKRYSIASIYLILLKPGGQVLSFKQKYLGEGREKQKKREKKE